MHITQIHMHARVHVRMRTRASHRHVHTHVLGGGARGGIAYVRCFLARKRGSTSEYSHGTLACTRPVWVHVDTETRVESASYSKSQTAILWSNDITVDLLSFAKRALCIVKAITEHPYTYYLNNIYIYINTYNQNINILRRWLSIY